MPQRATVETFGDKVRWIVRLHVCRRGNGVVYVEKFAIQSRMEDS